MNIIEALHEAWDTGFEEGRSHPNRDESIRDGDCDYIFRKSLDARSLDVTVNETSTNPPANGQRVLYWFKKWWIGQYDDNIFHGPQGFCDRNDAPYWMPEPAAPINNGPPQEPPT